jgi:hypothetical protein
MWKVGDLSRSHRKAEPNGEEQTVTATVMAVRGLVNLNGPGHYLHWGFIQMSVANAVVIALMVAVFVAAILVPFRGRKGRNR